MQIWKIADLDADGWLPFHEYAIACHIITRHLQLKLPIPATAARAALLPRPQPSEAAAAPPATAAPMTTPAAPMPPSPTLGSNSRCSQRPCRLRLPRRHRRRHPRRNHHNCATRSISASLDTLLSAQLCCRTWRDAARLAPGDATRRANEHPAAARGQVHGRATAQPRSIRLSSAGFAKALSGCSQVVCYPPISLLRWGRRYRSRQLRRSSLGLRLAVSAVATLA